MTEDSDNARKIPRAIFIDSVEAMCKKYGAESLLEGMNELYNKYKFMESQLLRGKSGLKAKMPDIKKSKDVVNFLKEKYASDNKEFITNYLVSDNIWSKATIPNDTGKVRLWLGANVMVEYTYDEAMSLLEKNYSNAELRMTTSDEDLNFIKDQITTMEVNMARVYN